MSEVGEVEILDRHGVSMTVLKWESGTRSAADGRDLRSVARTLPTERLRFWINRMKCCYWERNVLIEEIGRRAVRRSGKKRPGQRLLFVEW